MVCGGLPTGISLVSLPIVPNSGGDLWWFAGICANCGGLWWFAGVYCGGLRWFVPRPGEVKYPTQSLTQSHSQRGGSKQWTFLRNDGLS